MNIEFNTRGGVGPAVCKSIDLLPLKKKIVAMVEMRKAATIPPVPAEYEGLADSSSPRGYETAFAFVAARNPEALGFLDDPITALFAEYEALLALCVERGLPVVETAAPSALRERGFNRTFAFPIEILEAHLL